MNTEPAPKRRPLRSLCAIGVCLVLSALLAYVYAHDPGDAAAGTVLPRCMFHELTGLSCPGCGSTRAAHELMHGHLSAAVRLNPLAVCLMPILAYALGRLALAALRGHPAPPVFASVRGSWILTLAVLICVFWVGRNIPAYPFTLLGP